MPITKSSRYNARFNMVLLPAERAMLQSIADSVGLSESDVVRQFIRARYVELFGEKRPGKPKPKPNAKAARG